MNTRISLVTLLVLGLAAAACGSSAPSAPPASPAATAGASASPSTSPASSAPSAAPASPAPSASGPVAGPAGTAGPGDPDLTALLPSAVGGHQLKKVQFRGSDFANSGGVTKPLADLLASFGRTAADLTLASADDPTRAVDLSIAAFKVRDVPVDAFVAKYVPVVETAFGKGSVTQGTRAGKPVYIVAGTTGHPAQILLASAEAMFVVSGSSDALVDEALAALP